MPRLSQKQGRPSTVDLAHRVRAERERLGLTQEEAARRLGISRGSYRQIETVTVLQYGVLLALIDDIGMRADVLAPELSGWEQRPALVMPPARPPSRPPAPP